MEITLGLFAACLPTLRGLFRSESADSLIKGVRSLFTVGSASISKSKLNSSKRSGSLDRYEEAIHIEVNAGSKTNNRVWR